MIVLDTHIFVWWNQNDPKLTNYHREILEKERPNGLGICTISLIEPDIIVLNQEVIGAESRWSSESIIQNPNSVKLIVEVVSTNWRDDYYNKLRDYEEMGIEEYWIIDYAALGARKFIGNPKQPTFFVCNLVDGEYQMTTFRGNTPIVSPTFPQFNLSAQQIFNLAL